jgi:hypothetical protein
LFVAPADKAALIETIRRYALEEAPDEPGARTHRVDVIEIDPAKGSAVRYVAKHVSKNIDRFAVDAD